MSHEYPVVEQMHIHPEVQHIRVNARAYLQELSESMPHRGMALEEAKLLHEGIMSACLLSEGAAPLVTKFSAWNEPAEGEILSSWRLQNVNVPRVHGYGIVPSTADTDLPVAYTIMDAVQDDNKAVAPTLSSVLVGKPWLASAAGTIVGQELAKAHAVPVPGNTFGSQNIIAEFNAVAPSWNAYLQVVIKHHGHLFTALGYGEGVPLRLSHIIGELPFSNQPVYCHNDPALGNVLVSSIDPVDLKLIDPNPIIADPHWDFAHLLNKAVAAKARFTACPSPESKRNATVHCQYFDSARQAYELTSGAVLDPQLLLACQVVRSLKKFQWFSQNIHSRSERNISRNTAVIQINELL